MIYSWVRKRSLPRPLCHACVLEVNNYLFLLGGATQEEPGGDMVSSKVVYRYSRLSEVWTEFTEMITPRHDAGAVAVGENTIVLYWTTNIFSEGQITAKFLQFFLWGLPI